MSGLAHMLERPQAEKQEKEPARAEISEVAPGVLRMELPIRFPGLRHVNCYALVDERGAAVVDPGLPGPSNWKALNDRLRRAGLKLRDVHTVVVTHSHPDHFGSAARIARESGARVIAHEGFAFASRSSLDKMAHEHPRPSLKLRVMWRLFQLMSRTSYVPSVASPVREGDVLPLARRQWTVVHTPGHTGDHICLHDRETGTLIAGDHVLPTITPHISGLSSSADPLLAYFESLDRVAEIADVETVLPAHGHPFRELRARTEAIKYHHHERLAMLKQIGRDLGPAPVTEFARHLFPQRSWGWMAESETYAHLEHLRLTGFAERNEGRRGTILYRTGS